MEAELSALLHGPCCYELAGEKAKPPENEVVWSKGIAAKDVEKVVVHYAVDGVLTRPAVPAAKGKDATHRDPFGSKDQETRQR